MTGGIHVFMIVERNAVTWRTDDGRMGVDPIPGMRMLWPTVTLVLHRVGIMSEGGWHEGATAEIHVGAHVFIMAHDIGERTGIDVSMVRTRDDVMA
jgi:hypothetical protein